MPTKARRKWLESSDKAGKTGTRAGGQVSSGSVLYLVSPRLTRIITFALVLSNFVMDGSLGAKHTSVAHDKGAFSSFFHVRVVYILPFPCGCFVFLDSALSIIQRDFGNGAPADWHLQRTLPPPPLLHLGGNVFQTPLSLKYKSTALFHWPRKACCWKCLLRRYINRWT